jgi:hypothetical protein
MSIAIAWVVGVLLAVVTAGCAISRRVTRIEIRQPEIDVPDWVQSPRPPITEVEAFIGWTPEDQDRYEKACGEGSA